jgi:chemotaxis receptor (MCP) glutamine deamidase CheD
MHDNVSEKIIPFLERPDSKKNPISDLIMQAKFDEGHVPNSDYINDSNEMINVSMGEYGITSANHTNPILKTVGVWPCVAVALYAPDSKVAGLIHLPPGKKEFRDKDLRALVDAMQRNGVKKDELNKVCAYIVGGYQEDELPGIATNTLHDLGIDIIKTNIRALNNGYSIAIDARTGNVSNLRNIKQNTAGTIRSLTSLLYETVRLTGDERSLNVMI